MTADSEASDERIDIKLQDGVAQVRLNRPRKLNALDLRMFSALVEAGDKLAGMPGLRCVVLSGEGRAFCAGLDVAAFAAMAGDPSVIEQMLELHPGSPANLAQQTAYTWSALPVPVIAAIHGVCFGGGLQIALGADIRIASPDAELSVMEIKWGLIPDMTGVQSLRRLVSVDVAKELTFSGRKVRGDEAQRLGLVTRTAADPKAAADELAYQIASRSPDAIRYAKQLYDRSAELPLAQALQLEAELQRKLIGSPNQVEAVMAGMQKRPPVFGDPQD